MNIATDLIARVEDFRKTNKNPCKSYATETAAEKVADKVSKAVAEKFQGPGARPVRYIVVFNEAWGRWIIGFDMSELMARPKSGGYVGACGDHFCY